MNIRLPWICGIETDNTVMHQKTLIHHRDHEKTQKKRDLCVLCGEIAK